MRKDESRPTDNDHPLRLSWGFDDREGVQGSGQNKSRQLALAAFSEN
jgi:hypothetical protein